MPKLFKVGRMRYWGYRLYLNGSDCWFSTETENRKEAQKIADTHRRAVKGGLSINELFDMLMAQIFSLPAKEQKKARRELETRLSMTRRNSLALGDVWQAWLDRNGEQAPATLAGYEKICSTLIGWASKQGLKDLHEVTPVSAETFLADLWRRGMSPRTWNSYVKFCRSLFKTLKNTAGIDDNPFDGVKVKQHATQSRENFTVTELRLIAENAEGDWRYLVGLAVYSGLRLYDVVHLKWENIAGGQITLVPQKTRRTGKKITIMIHPGLELLLSELRAGRGKGMVSEYLFPDVVARYDRSPPAVSKDFTKFLLRLGIETTAKELEGRRSKRAAVKGFHSLRHSFVSLCAASGVPQSTIQDLVGHGSPAMTANYTHTSQAQQRAAIDTLPMLYGAGKDAAINVHAVEGVQRTKRKGKASEVGQKSPSAKEAGNSKGRPAKSKRHGKNEK